ncbi:hypothetical protein TL16_g03334 [Triparma laevis f. inornata]|uniref:Uncharacterized protein n=1 Tax=Triparma laevis f. inornata TaxID=1714386 RepID=A0A9W7A2M6_9STRA|nr:hypothetical protein TL16_g03334 [Triparma laevis f. inornata]
METLSPILGISFLICGCLLTLVDGLSAVSLSVFIFLFTGPDDFDFGLIPIFTIVWGWYKVLLPSQNKAARAAMADLLHNIFRITCIVSSMVGGILGVSMLPEKYVGTGSIQKELDRGAAGAKVAPTNEKEGEGGAAHAQPKKMSDAEKIIKLRCKIVAVVAIMCLYLVYDIVTAIGVVRHIIPPFCDGKNAFIRLISLMQVLLVFCITKVFPIKKPDVKGRTGQMGTTKVTATGSTEVESTGQ